MRLIKNLERLKGILTKKDLLKMEYAAREHIRYTSITFKVTGLSPETVSFEVSQFKNQFGRYFSEQRLIEIVKETFGQFFSKFEMFVDAKPYVKPASKILSSIWHQDETLSQPKSNSLFFHLTIAWIKELHVINIHKRFSNPGDVLFYWAYKQLP